MSNTILFEQYLLKDALGPSTPRELADRWASELADPKATHNKWKVLWIACGRQDPGHPSRRANSTKPLSRQAQTYLSETEGAHNYALWQQHMVQLDRGWRRFVS